MKSGPEAILERIADEQASVTWDVVHMYREVFGTKAGKQVLADILSVLGYYSMADKSTEEALLQDIAKLILHKLGVFNTQNAFQLVDAMMSIEPKVTEFREG